MYSVIIHPYTYFIFLFIFFLLSLRGASDPFLLETPTQVQLGTLNPSPGTSTYFCLFIFS